MFAARTFAALLAIAAPLLTRADVTPSEPGPGDVFKAGQTCQTTWLADTDSPNVWKDMSIELMTGTNLQMVHLTTIASGQDGTVGGKFEFPCPEVNPYSAIYFYQFSSLHTTVKTWTTRFTIASPDGQSVDPPNATQPASNGTIENIPWGVGALVDTSKATPPPPAGTSAPAGAGSTTPTAGNQAGSIPATASNTLTTIITSNPSATPSVGGANSTTNHVTNSTSSNSSAGNAGSGSMSSVSFDGRIWIAAMAVTIAAFMS